MYHGLILGFWVLGRGGILPPPQGIRGGGVEERKGGCMIKLCTDLEIFEFVGKCRPCSVYV